LTARVGDGSSCRAFAQIKQRVRASERLVGRCISGTIPVGIRVQTIRKHRRKAGRLAQNKLLSSCEYFAQVALAENNIDLRTTAFGAKRTLEEHKLTV
jgi:hypothetical protein